MSRQAPALTDFRRIVVKVGSSLLVDAEAGRIREEWLASLAADIARLHGEGSRHPGGVVGRHRARPRAVLKLLGGPLRLEDLSQPHAAAVGQIALCPHLGQRASAPTASPPARCW